MSEAGYYIYAVARGLGAGAVDGLTGLRGAQLRVVEHRGLAAIVSTVDLDEFGEEPLRHQLEDLDWLEEVARGHDEVVHAVSGVTPVLAPFRLATICSSEERVRERLESWYDDLVRALDRIEGRSEWSVKAFLLPADAASADLGEATESGTGAGTAYLMKRRAELTQQQQAASDTAALAHELHRAIAASAEACRWLPAQDRRLSGHKNPMVLNGAYLVDDEKAELFRATVDDQATRHPSLRLSVDGPWPPYSFASLETS